VPFHDDAIAFLTGYPGLKLTNTFSRFMNKENTCLHAPTKAETSEEKNQSMIQSADKFSNSACCFET